ncbi:dGTP triphosphohydrolase [Roseomonas haemaphysalidis]|uniref:DNTP triphosphohydrolase n=1 Tax=Roseomonas haemaphysalidis TaxID=2768162 RepID=A0ABS3KJB7_9PROT|nr:dNTP triphosphohydrolase [Roseomonas haemaphysalidis]MBO1077560.1 dNTP triphosphohydrolase [Roseomonas haemaphysalidis]
MDWGALFNTGRFPDRPARDDPGRNPFQIDQDRIVFSRPFRRLQQKTQVHTMIGNAHVRNRLVHTLEVASIGRSIGFGVGAALRQDLAAAGRTPDDLGYLVQAVCLAHDIGNPPFGHAGEEVIGHFMAEWLDHGPGRDLALDDDLRFFDGNAQGFRILTRADGYRERGGLRLTFASLGAFIKYPWSAADARAARRGVPGVKFNHFATEAEGFAAVARECGLSGPLPRHPAVWLMEAADDITYGLADMEDAVELGIVSFDRYAALVKPLAQVTDARIADEDGEQQKIALLRSAAAGTMIRASIDAFREWTPALLGGAQPPGKGLPDLLPAEVREPFAALARANSDTLYMHPRKVQFEIGARDVLEKTLGVFLEASLAFVQVDGDEEKLPLRAQQALVLMQDYRPRRSFSASETLRCAIDFVAGMTDDYAATLAARLRGL